MSAVTVESLWAYPITGGPAVGLDETELYPSGIVHDRNFIVAEETSKGLRRLGSKEVPKLFQLAYSSGDSEEVKLGNSRATLQYADIYSEQPADDYCDEFGDATPVWYTSAEYDEAFTRYLGRRVRFVQKTGAWIRGEVIPPYARANMPLHIISSATVSWLASINGSEEQADVRRFRPNVVLSGLEPNEELGMIGRRIRLGGAIVKIERGTPRCKVTGFDPESGEDLKDISLRSMEKAASRGGKLVACAGVYAYPQDLGTAVEIGARVSIAT